MSSNTENLKLYKYDTVVDKDQTFNIDMALNNNWDKIDSEFQNKADKAEILTDVVTTGTLKMPVDDLAVDSTKRAVVGVKGNTIVNLLGSAGDCEDISKLNAYQSIFTLDSTNKVFGNNGIKVTSTIASGGVNVSKAFSLSAGKCYCFSTYIKNGNCTRIGMWLSNAQGEASTIPYTSDANKFNRIFIKHKVTSDCNITADISGACTATGQYYYVDGIMLTEITEAEYNDPNYTPPAYVSGNQSVTGARVKSVGKNLFNPLGTYGVNFIDTINFISTSGKGIRVQTSSTSDVNKVLRYFLQLKSNTTYTFNYNVNRISGDNGSVYVYSYIARDISNPATINTWSLLGNATYTTNGDYVITFTTDSTGLTCISFNVTTAVSTAADITYDNIMLNEGDMALSYEPYKETVVEAPEGVELHKLPNGVCDEITQEGTLIKRIGKSDLSSSAWEYSSSATGYKVLVVPTTNMALNSQQVIKYDGKEILNTTTSINKSDMALHTSDAYNHLYLSIANTDSGWGDSYIPTADEIKAYFYGWRMYNGDTGVITQPYTGGTTKAWFRIGTTGVGFVTTVPTTMNSYGYTPYILYYQLQTPIIQNLGTAPDLTIEPNGSIITENTPVHPSEVNYTLYNSLRAIVDSNNRSVCNADGKRLDGVYATTQNITYYIDAINGNDNNSGLTPFSSLKTIMAAIYKIPQVVNYNVTIKLAEGTYNEIVRLKGLIGGFSISNSIVLKGAPYDYDYTNATKYKIRYIDIVNCQCNIYISGIECIEPNASGINVYNSSQVLLRGIRKNISSSYAGIVASYSNVYADNCYFANQNEAIFSTNCSRVVANNIYGSSLNVGMYANYGGALQKGGVQPTATIPDYFTTGGIITGDTTKLQWNDVAFQNGYYAPIADFKLQYAKDCFGIVYLKGNIQKTGQIVSMETICVLPVGYRPGKSFSIPMLCPSSNVTIEVDIDYRSGVVRINGNWIPTLSGSQAYTLDTTFKAEG